MLLKISPFKRGKISLVQYLRTPDPRPRSERASVHLPVVCWGATARSAAGPSSHMQALAGRPVTSCASPCDVSYMAAAWWTSKRRSHHGHMRLSAVCGKEQAQGSPACIGIMSPSLRGGPGVRGAHFTTALPGTPASLAVVLQVAVVGVALRFSALSPPEFSAEACSPGDPWGS